MPIFVCIASWLPHPPIYCYLRHSQILEKIKIFQAAKKKIYIVENLPNLN